MKILTPGQYVTIKEGEPGEDSTRIVAKIDRAHIESDGAVRYTVQWWNGRSLNEAYLTRSDIEPVEAEHTDIEMERIR